MKRRLARGFTLIELMIVVAIIGILAMIAIPNFMRFQAKAKQSEAKANLKAFYTAAKSSYAENDTYECGWCNWRPESGNKYNYYNGTNTLTGANGCDTTGIEEGQAAGTFTTGAGMDLDSDAICDQWRVDDTNNLTNVVNDVDVDA